jgi:hypothetical protein
MCQGFLFRTFLSCLFLPGRGFAILVLCFRSFLSSLLISFRPALCTLAIICVCLPIYFQDAVSRSWSSFTLLFVYIFFSLALCAKASFEHMSLHPGCCFVILVPVDFIRCCLCCFWKHAQHARNQMVLMQIPKEVEFWNNKEAYTCIQCLHSIPRLRRVVF